MQETCTKYEYSLSVQFYFVFIILSLYANWSVVNHIQRSQNSVSSLVRSPEHSLDVVSVASGDFLLLDCSRHLEREERYSNTPFINVSASQESEMESDVH